MQGQKTGGRKPGSLNKANREIRELAQQYGPEAIEALVAILKSPDSPPAAKVASANSILDRGYGKPRQPMEHGGRDGAPIEYRDLSGLSDEQLGQLATILEWRKRRPVGGSCSRPGAWRPSCFMG